MNKILKLTSVSMLAIMTTLGANAAGYTCEELVEYTSCNPGYFLTNNYCPYTHELREGVCAWGDDYAEAGYTSAEWCEELEGKFYSMGCIADYGEIMSFIPVINDTCEKCPAGSICSGGTESPTPCPAGSYCAETGLSAISGKCAVGSYSTGGAISCSTCPITGLNDKNGATVIATTADIGAKSPSACIVGDEYYFTDTKGTYHFKSDCALKPWKITISTQEECEKLGDGWWWNDEYHACYNNKASTVYAPTTEEECTKIYDSEWTSEGICICGYGDSLWDGFWSLYKDGLHCSLP